MWEFEPFSAGNSHARIVVGKRVIPEYVDFDKHVGPGGYMDWDLRAMEKWLMTLSSEWDPDHHVNYGKVGGLVESNTKGRYWDLVKRKISKSYGDKMPSNPSKWLRKNGCGKTRPQHQQRSKIDVRRFGKTCGRLRSALQVQLHEREHKRKRGSCN